MNTKAAALFSLCVWAAVLPAQADTSTAKVVEPSYCQGLELNLSDGEKAKLGAAIAPQLGAKSGKVTWGVRSGDWRIYRVEPEGMEPAYLFFTGDPSSYRYRGLWSGTAVGDDEQSIEHWLKTNVAGIPSKLSRCFAWQVTAS